MSESGEVPKSNIVEFPKSHIEPEAKVFDLDITIPVNPYSPDYLFFIGASEKGLVKFVPAKKEETDEEISTLKVVTESEEVGRLIKHAKQIFDLSNAAHVFDYASQGQPENIQKFLKDNVVEPNKKFRFNFKHAAVKRQKDAIDKRYIDLLSANHHEVPKRLLSTAHKNKTEPSGVVTALQTKTHEKQFPAYDNRDMEKFTSALFLPAWRLAQEKKELAIRIPARW